MRLPIAILIGLLLSSVALATRCPKDCMAQLKSQRRACKEDCLRHKPGKECRKACSGEFKASKAACKAATDPTLPACGATTTTTSSSVPGSSSTVTTTSSCPPATAAYCGAADCGIGGMPGCPQFLGQPPLCPSGMTCTATGESTCACTGESIPCGDSRLSGLTCNFCKWGTCPLGMVCGGVPKDGSCGFDCACH